MKPIILSFIFALCIFSSCDDKQSIAGETILKIERYKARTGHLPKNLTPIGIKETEEGPVYYEKQTDSTYIVRYGLSLGESSTYNSATKTWN